MVTLDVFAVEDFWWLLMKFERLLFLVTHDSYLAAYVFWVTHNLLAAQVFWVTHDFELLMFFVFHDF